MVGAGVIGCELGAPCDALGVFADGPAGCGAGGALGDGVDCPPALPSTKMISICSAIVHHRNALANERRNSDSSLANRSAVAIQICRATVGVQPWHPARPYSRESASKNSGVG